MTFSSSSTPSVNHSIKFNPETSRYEIQINISYGVEKTTAPVTPPPIKLNTLSCLTTKDLAQLNTKHYPVCKSFDTELKADPIPSFGLSDLNLLELTKYQIPCPEVITKDRIQTIVDSLKKLQKDCFI